MPSKSQHTENAKKDARRRSIVRSAGLLFAEKGYDGTSLQDIADAVGLLKGSLYYYIDNKEDLLFAVLQEAHEDLRQNMERVRKAEGGPLQKLRTLAYGHVLLVIRTYPSGEVFHRSFPSLSEPRKSEIAAERDNYDAYVRSLIVQGQKAGIMCPD